MSDSEEYDYGSDDEQYNYSDEDQNDEGEDDKIAIENAYYEGDDLKSEDPSKACELFEKVVALEGERGDEVKWRFKALENLVVLKFKLGQYDEMSTRYAEMLTHATTVTRNECGDGVNAVLDALADPGSKCSDEIMRKKESGKPTIADAVHLLACADAAEMTYTWLHFLMCELEDDSAEGGRKLLAATTERPANGVAEVIKAIDDFGHPPADGDASPAASSTTSDMCATVVGGLRAEFSSAVTRASLMARCCQTCWRPAGCRKARSCASRRAMPPP